MAQRAPPAVLLELQSNFPVLKVKPFVGNWTEYELRFTTAVSQLPAVAALISDHLQRPTQHDADMYTFPSKTGHSELTKFKRNLCAYL